MGGLVFYIKEKRITGGGIQGDFATDIPGLKSQLEATSHDSSEVEKILQQDPVAQKANQLCLTVCQAWATSLGPERERLFVLFSDCLRRSWDTVVVDKADSGVVGGSGHAIDESAEACSRGSLDEVQRRLSKVPVPGFRSGHARLTVSVVGGRVEQVECTDAAVHSAAASALVGKEVARGTCSVFYEWTPAGSGAPAPVCCGPYGATVSCAKGSCAECGLRVCGQ